MRIYLFQIMKWIDISHNIACDMLTGIDCEMMNGSKMWNENWP
jgi:hypothetical protein